MTQRSYPFVGGPTTDVEFSLMFQQLFPASVVSGLVVSADSTGLNVKVASGSAYVRGHFFRNTAIETLTIAAGSSQPRIDVVAARLEYGSVNDIHLIVKQGTPAATPAAPSLTQSTTGVWELPLANVAVAANAVTIAAGNVTSRIVTFAAAFKTALSISQAWADITGKPSSFPPAAHSHALTDSSITGVLAVSKGGTGSTSASAARAALGAAATAHSHVTTDIKFPSGTDFDTWVRAVKATADAAAPASHNHSAADITSGTLPISRGGTGATSASSARNNLEIRVQATSPGHLNGRVWVKI